MLFICCSGHRARVGRTDTVSAHLPGVPLQWGCCLNVYPWWRSVSFPFVSFHSTQVNWCAGSQRTRSCRVQLHFVSLNASCLALLAEARSAGRVPARLPHALFAALRIPKLRRPARPRENAGGLRQRRLMFAISVPTATKPDHRAPQ